MTAYEELNSRVCFCGKKKTSGKSFCWNCWKLLPRRIQNALYDSCGYQTAVETAHSILANKNVQLGAFR
jgi:hypothetical protein